jgi:methionine-rich copper-binding protein CopC
MVRQHLKPIKSMSNLTPAEYTRGALCGLGAACIWSGWIVVARLGLRTNFTPWDIAALRFGVGGLLLLPYLWRKGFAIERLGWMGLAALVLGCGAPMVLLVNAGLLFAPAAHAGALFSGVVPMMVALLAAPILHEAFTSAKIAVIAVSLFGGAAYAHPQLQSADPAPGAATATSPKEIRIAFNENVIPQMSGVELTDQTGKIMPTGKAATDPANKKLLVVPVNEQLSPGDYKVEWHAVSDDTHRVKGSFSFSVAR